MKNRPYRDVDAFNKMVDDECERIESLPGVKKTNSGEVFPFQFGVRFSGHGSEFIPEQPDCSRRLRECVEEAIDWELIADTIGGASEIVISKN